jgi:antitoxin component of MazEF toxin-antitoxin module
MLAKLRRIGNSIGVILPTSELQAIHAKEGDQVELEIHRLIRTPRKDWEDPTRWAGASSTPLLLDDTTANSFDNEEWQW